MKLIFLLDAGNLDFSSAEAINKIDLQKIKRSGKLLFGESNENKKMLFKSISELALTRFAFEEIFTTKISRLEETISKTNWSKHIKSDFMVRRIAVSKEMIDFTEPYLGHLIKENSRKSVNLKIPGSRIYFLFEKGKVICGKLIYAQRNIFEERSPSKRPGFFPSSMDPKIARAMVNLLGAGKKDLIADLMCGTGGILIEALFMEYKVFGQDIDPIMLAKAKENLIHYDFKKFTLKIGDSTKIKKHFNYIILDLPYGKNNSVKDLDSFYLEFLINLRKILGKRAVIGFPNRVHAASLIKKAGFKIKGKFFHYLNKNISKLIYILE